MGRPGWVVRVGGDPRIGVGRGPVALEEAIVERSGELRDVDSDAVVEGRLRGAPGNLRSRGEGGVKARRGAEEEERGSEYGDEGKGEEERRDGAKSFEEGRRMEVGAGVLERHLVIFASATLSVSVSASLSPLSESRTGEAPSFYKKNSWKYSYCKKRKKKLL